MPEEFHINLSDNQDWCEGEDPRSHQRRGPPKRVGFAFLHHRVYFGCLFTARNLPDLVFSSIFVMINQSTL